MITLGTGWRWFWIEGSAFHGAEPDENRWNFEHGALESTSGRIKIHFPSGWSGQVSFASRHNPEVLFPGNIHRTTASLHYGADGDRPLAVSLIWGRDNDEHNGAPSTINGFGVTPLAVRRPNAPEGLHRLLAAGGRLPGDFNGTRSPAAASISIATSNCSSPRRARSPDRP